MPNAYIKNFVPIGNGPAMSAIVEMLVSAGWTYQSSGTGTNGIFSPAPATVTISQASPGIVAWTTHGLRPHVPVVFTTSGSLPAEITAGVTYYVTTTSFTANQFTVSATLGGSPINTTSASTATTTATVKKVFTTTPAQGSSNTTSSLGATLVRISNGGGSAATVTWPAHGLMVGEAVRFDVQSGGTLPTGISNSTTYFIISSGFTADSFQIATTVGGSAVNTSTVGTGFMIATCPTSWGNANAWARIQDPSGTREFLFQHSNGTSFGSSSASIQVRYSSAAKFTSTANGAISATVAPTATDERYLRGTAGGSNSTFFPAGLATGSIIFQGAAMSSAPYGWWFASQAKGGGSRFACMMFDPVVSVAEDPDPYVIHVGNSPFEGFSMHASTGGLGQVGDSANWTKVVSGTTPGTFAFMDAAKSLFLYVQPLAYACTGPLGSSQFMGVISGSHGSVIASINTGYLGNNTFSGLADALPVAWARMAAPNTLGNQSQTVGAGLKGWSTLCRWTVTNRTSFVDTLDNKNWICVGPFWLPWDGVTTPKI